MISIFTIPADSVTLTLANVSDFINDAWPFIALAIGIPLAFWVVAKLMELTKMPGEKGKREIDRETETYERFNKKYGEKYNKW